MNTQEDKLIILHQDKDIIVCRKPAGVAVQTASVREKDMVSILKNQVGGEIFVVHRLDQPVEGVLVFARNKRAAAELSRQAADGSMRKIYRAICEAQRGAKVRVGDSHTLTDYLVKDGEKNLSRTCGKNDPGAKRAELTYRILKSWYTGTQYAEVEIELKTGRHHQIRVQMAHAGMPIAGDRKYNPAWSEKAGKDRNQSGKDSGDEGTLALCAVSLSFKHPTNKKTMTFEIKPEWPVSK